MKSVTDKIETSREATATSTVTAKKETIQKLIQNDLPKKDVLIVARVAGIAGAKKTADLIPYCHPLPIDAVEIQFDVQAQRIVITSTVQAIWKTGVEMEALTAVSIAALTIYDMLKPIDQTLEIGVTKLVEKRGGKSDFHEVIPKDFTAAVIVTSDGTFQGTRQDKSGKIIKEKLEDYGIHPSYIVLPDEEDQILKKLKELCTQGTQLIFTTGGTGLGPRDVTVEATRKIIEREIPGIMEAARSYGQRRTPYAMLSRGFAGQAGNTLIVNLPGSSNGVRESLNAIFPALLHGFPMIKGKGH